MVSRKMLSFKHHKEDNLRIQSSKQPDLLRLLECVGEILTHDNPTTWLREKCVSLLLSLNTTTRNTFLTKILQKKNRNLQMA